MTPADGFEAGCYVAEFARSVWGGVSQVALESGGHVASFTLAGRPEDETVTAEAVIVTGGGARHGYRYQVWPSPHGAPVTTAASLFVTAIEERILAPRDRSPEQQIATAARVVENCRQATGRDSETLQSRLAAALHYLAQQLARHRRYNDALPPIDEAIAAYRMLADQHPARCPALLRGALATKASIFDQLGREAEAADIRRSVTGSSEP